MKTPSKCPIRRAIREARAGEAAAEEALLKGGLLPVVRRQFELFAHQQRLKIAQLRVELPPEVAAWWDILGIESRATRQDVERGFLDKAKTAHPDRINDNRARWDTLCAAFAQGKVATANTEAA